MKILHLEASSGWGGQEMRILKEAEGMRRRGHEVVLAVMRGGGLVQYARNAGFTVYELNFRRSGWLPCLWQLLRILKKHQIDLVNTHSSLDAWIGGIAARLAKRPIVRTRHLSAPIKPGLNSKLLYGKLADFVVTTCSSILPALIRQSGQSPDRCRCIATGVDPQKIASTPARAAAFREQLGLRPTDFLVGTACFMRSWKGIIDLLQAAHLLRHIPDLRWVIIGGGHEKIYREKAQELRLDGIVHFTGHLPNPFPALAALDLFALLSTANEGISQAILQAAYLAKPLLATPTGGLPEVCLNGITGLQVPIFAPEEVAKKVLELKEKPVLRSQFGQNGHELVRTRFTLEQMLDAMERVYGVCDTAKERSLLRRK